jgi:hypothetical protein
MGHPQILRFAQDDTSKDRNLCYRKLFPAAHIPKLAFDGIPGHL